MCDGCEKDGVVTKRMRNGSDLCPDCENEYENQRDDDKEDF